jgi:[ribosomal protein S18]-alanine N-acetyltransferase
VRKPRDASLRAGPQSPPPASNRGAHVHILRVTEPVTNAQAIDSIAASSFTNYGFSVEEELSRPWARIWIALSNTHPGEGSIEEGTPAPHAVGFLVSWHVADEVHILNIATSPPVRRRGIGVALMRESIEYARTNHVRIVLLEVRRSNRPAIRLYRKLGFTAMGVRPGYYSDNGEDAVEMVLGIDPTTGELLPGRDEIRIDV